MKYSVLIDPQAKQDMKDIFRYVEQNDDNAPAEKLLNGLENACRRLEEFPERGHVPVELRATGIKKYLEVHFKPYRIIYEIDKDNVYVHAVIDGRRDVAEILSERLLR